MDVINHRTTKPDHGRQQKILLMGHSDGHGGAQTAFRELYNFVQGEGHVVKVIALTNRAKQQQPFPRATLVGRITHRGSVLIRSVKKIWGLLWAGVRARQFRPDIFVSVGLNNSANGVARLLSNRCFKIGQDFIATRPLDDAIWRTSRAALNGVAVQAPSMIDYWQTVTPNTAGVNWLPCFPEPPVRGVLRQQNEAPKQEIKLSYFGRLAGNKGLPLLIRALAAPAIPAQARLDLWGSGNQEAPLRKLVAELGLERKVRFLGQYPAHEEGARLMASYDALVLCSTEMEGLPLVLLEAMAYGLPFLATDVGAIRDCCVDNPDAVLVQPNLESIVQGLQTLMQRIEEQSFDPGRLRAFYEAKFSSEVMADRWRVCFQNPKRFFYESY